MERKILAVLIVLAACMGSMPTYGYDLKRESKRKVFPDHENIADLNEKVIVGNDTVDLVMPEHNFGRYDRGLFNYLFIPKGQWMFGLNASYGEFDADDVEILSAVQDLNFKGKQYAIRPMIGYFFRNNQSIGIKFDYTRAEMDLGSLTMDLGEDLSFSINDISYYSSKYCMGVFYRNYVGLGKAKRFGIFNEAALTFGGGSSRFKRPYNSLMRDTRTNFTTAELTFSPGVCVFIMDYLSFNISFGVFGVHMTNEKQRTYMEGSDEVEKSSRFSSGANFKFNLFNINFGLGVHI